MKFVRHAAHRKKRLSKSYRRPRGLQNKMRLEFKGFGSPVKVGFRSEKKSRFMQSGLEVVRVSSVKDLEAIDVKTQGAIITNVGMRKELAILAAAKTKQVKVFACDIDARVKELESRFKSRKQESAARAKVKEEREQKAKKEDKKLEDAVEEAAAKEKAEPKQSERKAPEKTEEEKVKDKVLTKAR